MKKFLSALAVVALSGTMAVAAVDNGNAKGFGHRGHRHRMLGAKLAQKLNLTDAQKDQLKAFRQSFREENKAFFQSVRQTHQDLRAARQAGDEAKVNELKATAQSQREQMKQLRQAEHEKFLSVLTPDQRTQLEALKAEWKANHDNKQK